MSNNEVRDYFRRGPWADGCIFNPQGVVCKDEKVDCVHCGWCPAEAKRRLLALREARGADPEAEK